MADKKRKSKNRREEDDDKPTKEECSVAKHLRFGLEVKEARLAGMTVKYFIASEAVDKLMDSKWATNKNKQDNLFSSRQSCVHYLDRLLQKGMFHRALKVERKRKEGEEEKKGKKKEGELEESQDERKLRRRRKEKETKEKESEKEETEKEEKKEDKNDDKKKKEKKLKFRMHDDQNFLDGENYYVWIYDPVNVKTFIIGLLMVLGSIAVCLFPLWPPIVRQGVYYLSLAGAAFVGFIIVLAIFRYIPFSIIWLATGGKHHFWLLPNLTEDVGFFESFKPFYTHTIKQVEKKKKDSTTKSAEKSTTEKSAEKQEKTDEKNSDKESESSDNEYEMVDKSEVTDTDQ